MPHPQYAWVSTDPSPLALNQFISSHTALWPQWDWRHLVEAGILARSRNDPIEGAIKKVRAESVRTPSDQILVAAWIKTGLIYKVSSDPDYP